MAGSFKVFKQASRASKPKHQKWDKQFRFSGGHDAACLALLPEGELVDRKDRNLRRRTPRVGVYRGPTFGLSREERVASDAAFLMDAGLAYDLDDAIEKAIANYEGK